MNTKTNYFLLLLSIGFLIFSSCDDSFSTDSFDENISKKERTKVTEGIIKWTSDIPNPCKQVCLVAGQHMYVGTVDVVEVEDGILVTYAINEPNVYLEEVHLDIFSDVDQFKNAKKISNGGAIPGKFEYKMSWSADQMITSHSVLILNSYIEKVFGSDPNCLFVASHASLSNGETAWGGLCDSTEKETTNLNTALQFPGANWSVYFEFCKEECSEIIDFTYAWEDLQNLDNDGDYNDLVIKSNLIKSYAELKIKFFASARGAAAEHQFKIRIPKQGIDDIFGAFSYEDDPSNSDYYIITIWESTRAQLPAEGYSSAPFAANTAPEDDNCEPTSEVTISLVINSSFIFDENTPYEPLITVSPSGASYDLYIYEISGRDTWLNGDGKEYPNGIIIPRDWKWPLEYTFIESAYPNFKSITDGWNPSWAETVDNSKVFKCN